jgi:hypothetical protein
MACLRLPVGLLVCAGCYGCSYAAVGHHFGTEPIDGSLGEAGADAASTSDASDGGITCTMPIGDAGFSDLAHLPVAQLCVESAQQGYPGASLTETRCGPWIVARVQLGVDCEGSFIFDAATGALVATAGGCDIYMGCATDQPGFQYPLQCTYGTGQELCPDGGIEAGDAGDASAEAAADGGADAPRD